MGRSREPRGAPRPGHGTHRPGRARSAARGDGLSWEPYRGRTVAGDVRILRGVCSPQLGNTRDLLAYLPPSYESGGRDYPVLFGQDGDNLFDADTSYAGEEWHVDETLERLAGEGLEAIVVALPNMGVERELEYVPGRRGDAYVDFVAETVRPLVARTFRIAGSPARTGLLGSSLGGVISLHGLVARPDVFGLAAALSPALWFGGEETFALVEQAPAVPGRIWLDVGDEEAPDRPAENADYVEGVRRMEALLRAKGLGEDRLRVVVERGGRHEERDWARRVPDALRFLLGTVPA